MDPRLKSNFYRRYLPIMLTLAAAILPPAKLACAEAFSLQPDATQPLNPTSDPADEANATQGMTPTVAPSDATSADLTNLSLEDLMNVEVTSVSKKKQSVADAPAAVTVISQDDIRDSGFSTIPDLLRLVPGMDVASVTASSWAISVRGLNTQFANNLLVLQDGRSVYTPVFGGVFWNSVDYILEDIDRIEVIRGPGATLWGANAVNGVINITTKDAQDTQGGLLSARGSNVDSDLEARYGGKLSDDTYYRVYGKGTYDAGFDADSGGTAGDEFSHFKSGFRIDKHTSDTDSLTLQGDVGYDNLNEPSVYPVSTPPFTQTSTLTGSDHTANLLARMSHNEDDDNGYSLQLYYDYLGVNDGNATFEQNTADIQFQDRFSLGDRNNVTWGLGYNFVNVSSNSSALQVLTLVPETRSASVYNGFIQDAITLQPDHWVFTAGTKLEHNDFTGFELEPSARLLWTPNKQNSVWASVSRAVKTPSIVDEDIRAVVTRFDVPAGPTVIPGEALVSGNSDLVSTDLVAYELGYRAQLTRQVSVDVAGYYNSYNHMASNESAAPIPGATFVLPFTIGDKMAGDIYGAEVSSEVQITPAWKIEASYSALAASFHATSGSNDATTAAQNDHSAPQNQAQIHSYLDVTKNIQFNASVYYTDRIVEFNVPAFVSTDLSVSWQPTDRMNVSVGVMNLFDNEHVEYGSTNNQSIVSAVPRTIYAQVSYAF